MTDLDAFGPYVDEGMVERAAIATLKLCQDEYLSWAERRTGREVGRLPRIRSWVTSGELERWPEQQLPSVLALCPGLADPPLKDGGDMLRADFDLGIAVVVAARDRQAALDIGRVYTAAFRQLLLQQRLGSDFPCEAMELVNATTDLGPTQDRLQLAAGRIDLRADVRDFASSRGPVLRNPSPEAPYPDGPKVQSTSVDVRPEETS